MRGLAGARGHCPPFPLGDNTGLSLLATNTVRLKGGEEGAGHLHLRVKGEGERWKQRRRLSEEEEECGENKKEEEERGAGW